MKNVLIVCSGNIFRSPVTEVILRKKFADMGLADLVHFTSRGIQGQGGVAAPRFNQFELYETEFKLARLILKESGIDISRHIAKPIDKESIENAHLILALGDNILTGKGGLSGYGESVSRKTIVYEIPDPAEDDTLNKYSVVIPKILDMVEKITPEIVTLIISDETRKELSSKLNAESKKEFK